MSDPLVETWEINGRINTYLIGALPSTALAAVASSGGRKVWFGIWEWGSR